jgi:uroporphyrinogen decarboxylase
MNSVDRVKTALKGQRPDRVPVLEFVVDPKVAAAAVPGCQDAVDCMDRLGMDGVACGAQFATVEKYSDGSWKDEWGVVYMGNAELVPHPMRGPIESLADVHSYTPPVPDTPHRLAKLREIVARYKGKRAICFHHRAAFMWSAYLCGLDNLLADFLAEPELAHQLMDKVLDTNLVIVRNAIRTGAEVVILGDDYAHNLGPLMSPTVFREFIAPRLKRMIDLIHAEGALCIKHSDGNLYSILDAIVAAGPDGINPIEMVAGMTLRETRRRAGANLCLVGNIDCGKLLSFGTIEEVREAVRQAIAEGTAGGSFILSSSNSIHSSCNPANVVAMVTAAREYGDLS